MAITRQEQIVNEVIRGGSTDEKRAAWRLVKTESARLEAELVNIYLQAQDDIERELIRLKDKDLQTYQTQARLNSVKKILSQMLGNSETVANQLDITNLLEGKIRATATTNKKGDELVNMVSLNEVDQARVKRMVEQMMGRIQNAADLTQASVARTLNTASVRANMNLPQKPETKAEEKEEIKGNKKEIESAQDPESIEASAERIDQKRPQRDYKQKPLTKEEIKEIKRNPALYAENIAKTNVSDVLRIRNTYVIGRRECDKLREEAIKSQVQKELKGSGAAKAAREMFQSLRNNGVSAFVDRGGKRWSLSNYCIMSARTTSRQSSNFGEVFARPEHDLYYIVPHGSSCPICAKFEGRVYSRSGTNPNYPPLSKAFSKIDPNGTDDLENTYMTIHPNCRHTIVRYIERAQTPKQIEEMRKKSNASFDIDPRTEEQIKAYKERERVAAAHSAAVREYQQMMQVLTVKELGPFPAFERHRNANDAFYKGLRSKYNVALNTKAKQAK